MAKSDFENLKVYQMSEILADEIWQVGLAGIGSHGTRSEDKWCGQQIVSGQISRKAPGVAASRTIEGSLE